MTRPQSDEAAPYYSRYIDLISSDDIVTTLTKQLDETGQFLSTISEEKSLHQYAADKWTIRQVLNHINDAERVFLHRAFWFGRSFPDALPSFDQDISVVVAQGNNVTWKDHTNEFRNIRQATLSFFKNLPEEGWSRSGVASENPVTVRALAYIIAGHLEHHRKVIQEKYL
jgi:uncharacterized damage-inducible protein DinB